MVKYILFTHDIQGYYQQNFYMSLQNELESIGKCKTNKRFQPVVDPGFPTGGHGPVRGGGGDPDAGAFWQKCM